jgi:DGQHR domain-containing protein
LLRPSSGPLSESGYQRDLIPKKLKDLNHFLATGNYFANNLVVCFGNNEQSLSFTNSDGKIVDVPDQGATGKLRIPKEYCSAELIDGQHRLYGYLDFTGNPDIAAQLDARKRDDRINVIAIEDPGEEERPLLFVDINCNQTRVSMRNIWALMGTIRPTSQMGYIANLVRALNGTGPLRGKIHIPGKNASADRVINIANLGKGIKDRQLVTISAKKDKLHWNFFDASRRATAYPEHPSKKVIKDFNTFFSAVKLSAPADWKMQKDGFILTNNGLNVLLRVLAKLKRQFYELGIPYAPSTVRGALGREVGRFIEHRGVRHLRGLTSSEDGRGKAANALWERIASKMQPGKPRAMAARA